MEYTIEWSPEADEDLELIAEYISRDSPFYASAVIANIFSVAKTISQQPFIGRMVPEINNKMIRERFVYSYRLIYQIKEKKITMVSVIHGKRLLENISERLI